MKKILILLLVLLPFKSFSNDCGMFFDNLTSPLCTNAKYILFTGTVLSSGLYLTRHDSSYPIQKQARDKNHLKQWGHIGGEIGFGYLNGGYVLLNLFTGGDAARKNAEHMTEASLYTLAVTLGLKSSISERRPGYPDDTDSFPSGHASFSFAFASVVTARHGIFWGFLAHLAAAYISFSRINDNWHYLHDVVAGMTIGMSYGWGIYLNHESHQKPYWFAFAPVPQGGMMLSFQGRF